MIKLKLMLLAVLSTLGTSLYAAKVVLVKGIEEQGGDVRIALVKLLKDKAEYDLKIADFCYPYALWTGIKKIEKSKAKEVPIRSPKDFQCKDAISSYSFAECSDALGFDTLNLKVPPTLTVKKIMVADESSINSALAKVFAPLALIGGALGLVTGRI